MENELKNLGEFHEHYGRFPYIIHRMFPGIYMQIPVLFSYDHQQGELPGVTILLNAEMHSELDLIHSESIRTQLKQLSRKVKTDLEQKLKELEQVTLERDQTFELLQTLQSELED